MVQRVRNIGFDRIWANFALGLHELDRYMVFSDEWTNT